MTDAFAEIEKKRISKGHVKLALIDPDSTNDLNFEKIINRIYNSDIDGVLIGGSNVEEELYDKRIEYLTSSINLPIMLFPGSSSQITSKIDTMLYLNLISGRNPKYLIEEHVNGSMDIYENNIKAIPTAYILLNGGNQTSVEIVSGTSPLDMRDYTNVLKHALAGQYLGNQILYFDCGSGAENIMNPSLLSHIKKYIKIPIMVGGGIKSEKDMNMLISNGASYIVCGTMYE